MIASPDVKSCAKFFLSGAPLLCFFRTWNMTCCRNPPHLLHPMVRGKCGYEPATTPGSVGNGTSGNFIRKKLLVFAFDLTCLFFSPKMFEPSISLSVFVAVFSMSRVSTPLLPPSARKNIRRPSSSSKQLHAEACRVISFAPFRRQTAVRCVCHTYFPKNTSGTRQVGALSSTSRSSSPHLPRNLPPLPATLYIPLSFS